MTALLEPPATAPVLIPQYTASDYNAWLFYEVLDRIVLDPDTWDQAYWGLRRPEDEACGTSHCLGGWTLIVANHAQFMVWDSDRFDLAVLQYDEVRAYLTDDRPIESVAAGLLGLDDVQAEELFLEYTTGHGADDIPTLWEKVSEVTDGEISYLGYQAWCAQRAA